MKKSFLIVRTVLMLFASAAVIRAADYQRNGNARAGEPHSTLSATPSTVLEQANHWEPSQPIPAGLLRYRKSGRGPTYIRDPEDSASIIAGITNGPLLVEMVFDSRIDDRVFEQTVDRALHLAGPQSFFGDVGRRYHEKPEWLLFPRHKRLFTEANQRHSVVDAIFIGESEMPVRDAFETLRRMINDLQLGKSWEAVFNEYSLRLRSEIHMGASLPVSATNEKPVTVSKVSQFGPVVLCERPGPDETLVFDLLPRDHRMALLKGAQGEVLLIQDPPRRRVILYRVREVYVPKRG
jgi:hypothetical protein